MFKEKIDCKIDIIKLLIIFYKKIKIVLYKDNEINYFLLDIMIKLSFVSVY